NDYNIWYADKIDTGWSAPKALPGPINTAYQEYFFSISNHGNAFFSSNRPGGNGSFDIYQVKISADGTMSKPKNIGAPINTSKYEYDPFISPDETFMVFSIKKKGNSDIYISFKNEKEKWSNVINLGDKINISKQDFAPSLTPDNNFLIYTNEGKLKWVSTEILVSLR
ncbi:MAG: hypothetical protein MI922_03225, partial [Bacteroidales bacterium]|nr:hypothetical protein [Bacteroidales bacterium]